jgi:hypothetical protein
MTAPFDPSVSIHTRVKLRRLHRKTVAQYPHPKDDSLWVSRTLATISQRICAKQLISITHILHSAHALAVTAQPSITTQVATMHADACALLQTIQNYELPKPIALSITKTTHPHQFGHWRTHTPVALSAPYFAPAIIPGTARCTNDQSLILSSLCAILPLLTKAADATLDFAPAPTLLSRFEALHTATCKLLKHLHPQWKLPSFTVKPIPIDPDSPAVIPPKHKRVPQFTIQALPKQREQWHKKHNL